MSIHHIWGIFELNYCDDFVSQSLVIGLNVIT